MIATLPKKLITLLLCIFFYTSTALAGNEPIPSGSFIVNMGVVPQTYANGLKPWGMIWSLIHNYKVPVKWVINQSKQKDGADFTYNGTEFKGGTLIILKKYRTAKVDSTINSWLAQGVVGITTTSEFTTDVTYTIKYNPLWTFDFQNGKIAQNYLTIAGIPLSTYPMKEADALNSCDDLFVMPHADPTWDTHSHILSWNKTTRGWLWYGCHAVSVIENTINPLDSTVQMNFLTTDGLVNFDDHDDASPPYNYRYPSDPEMQFMGTMDDAVTNGSEQVFLPKMGSGWRPSTNVSVYDPSVSDVPGISPGEAAIVAYGRAFGDTNYGKVMFQGGHSFDKGNSAAVAAIRAFFNFSYLSVLDKIVTPDISGPITGNGAGKYNFTATLPAGFSASDYTYHWTANIEGTFSNEFGPSTLFTPAGVSTPTASMIMVTITDGCGRQYYQTIDFNVTAIPPVAVDRTSETIINSPGTGPQSIGNITPLTGTDADGFIANYIIKSLPGTGVMYYDNDNNSVTADLVISSLPSGGLILTNAQMKTLKYDPADNFGGNTSFQYTVQDNTNLFSLNTATYTIPVNPPPVSQNFVCTPVVSNADVTSVCPLFATDNINVVSYTIVSLPAASKCEVYLYKALVKEGQVLSPSQISLLTYKSSGTYIGYAEILYTATDNDGAKDETPATITLQMVNQSPETEDISSSVIVNPAGTTSFPIPALKATDPDGTIISYTVTNVPSSSEGKLYFNNNGTYTQAIDNQKLTVAQSSSLKFDPADTYSGVVKFKYTATDNGNLTDNTPAVYSIPVKAIPPQVKNITNPSIYSGAGLSAINSMDASDNDTTDIITAYIIKTLPSATMGVLYYNNGGVYEPCLIGLEINAQSAQLKFNPTPGYTGSAKFAYTAKDDEGLTDPTAGTFTIPITNKAPNASNIRNTKIYDTSGAVTIKPLVATDQDGYISSFVILSLPDAKKGILSLQGVAVTAGQNVNPAQAGLLQFSPVLHADGDAEFEYTAIDNLGLADNGAAKYEIPIAFVPHQRSPKADNKLNAKLNVKAVAKTIMPVSGSDSDGVVTSYQITKLTSSSEGILYLQGVPVEVNQVISPTVANQFTFSPTGTFQGTASFNYIAIDNDSLPSAEAIFNIPLENTPPVANDFTKAQIKSKTTVVIPGLSATDEDGTISSYKILSLPVMGTLQYEDGVGVWKNATINITLTLSQAAKLRIIANDTTGITSFTFKAKDNLNSESNVATYTIPIGTTALNQKPIVYNVTSNAVMKNAAQTLISPFSGLDADGSVIAYVIQTIPPAYHGTLYYDSSGYYSVLRGVLKISVSQASSLKFKPSGLYTGNVTISFKAIDDDNEYSINEAIYTIPITDFTIAASDITNAAIPNSSGPALINSLSATGVITKYIIMELPNASSGVLMLDGAAVSKNQEIPVLKAGKLEFDPSEKFSGNAKFKYTATNNFGTIDKTPAVFTIPVTNQLPVAESKVSQVITNYIGTPAQAIPQLTGIDKDGSISAYFIKSLPAGGKLYRNGTLISSIPAGGVSISSAQASQLSFDPDDNFGGTASFTYTVRDNDNNLSTSAASYQISVNTPPVSDDILSNSLYAGQQRTSIPALSGTDDGAVMYYNILTLPASHEGILYLNNISVTNLSQVDSLTPAQLNQLSFQPLTSFDGAIFTYTTTDNTGLIDVTPAVYTIPYVVAAPLPIDLLSFSGFKSNTDNILKWATSREVNSLYIDVERSNDGNTFSKLERVAAKGNSSTNSDYSFADKNVTNGLYYYRLKFVSTDSNFKYSKIVAIKRDGQTIITSAVYPNPFIDRINVDIQSASKGYANLHVYDINGKKRQSLRVAVDQGSNQIQITNLYNLNAGMYFLKINNNGTETKVKLFKVN